MSRDRGAEEHFTPGRPAQQQSGGARFYNRDRSAYSELVVTTDALTGKPEVLLFQYQCDPLHPRDAIGTVADVFEIDLDGLIGAVETVTDSVATLQRNRLGRLG